MSITAAVGSRLAIEPTRLTATTIVMRAVAAGVLGGLLASLFVVTIGEQSIDAAIAIEEATASGEPHDHGFEIGRGVQVAGGVAAVVVYGGLVGVVFGTVLAGVRHRLAVGDDFRRAVLLAAAGFVAVVGLPAVKYPANPPAVGDPATVAQRTVAYVTLVAASLVLVVVASAIHRRLAERFDRPSAFTLTAAAAVVGGIALVAVWPDSQVPIPAEFPADLLWRFRLESLATQAILWSVLGFGTGWLLTRRDAGTARG